MIVTCPACSARYKINANKITGRGAKITCPRCEHRFVVHRDSSQAPKRPTPESVDQLDFSTLGITWRVRHGLDVTWEFTQLSTLKGWLESGRVDTWDRVSYDNRDWESLSAISNIEAYFHEIWEKARRGEIETTPDVDPPSEFDEEEDESDAPTTIVGRGSDLASEIRKAVTAEKTPASSSRVSLPPSPARPVPAHVDEALERDAGEQGLGAEAFVTPQATSEDEPAGGAPASERTTNAGPPLLGPDSQDVVATPAPAPGGTDRASPESPEGAPQSQQGPAQLVTQPSAPRRAPSDSELSAEHSGSSTFILGLVALAVIALVVAAVVSLGGVP